METTIQPVNSLSLSDMRERFHLTHDRSDRFFGEWMGTNGREVLFLKLQPQQPPTYSQSRVYQLVDRLEDLPQILQGLKAIGQQMST